jgi:hypothetical protein
LADQQDCGEVALVQLRQSGSNTVGEEGKKTQTEHEQLELKRGLLGKERNIYMTVTVI